MTPALRAVYDELVERAAADPWLERCRGLREALAARCGSVDRDHPAAAARDAASMEYALVAGGLAREIGETLVDPAERAEAALIANAIGALLVFEDHAGLLVGHDRFTGAAWWIAPEDDVGRDVRLQLPDSPVAQCRIVIRDSGCVILPGVVFHPADAERPIKSTLARAAELGLTQDQVFESLLRMELSWQTLSRVKVSYAYRAEALPSPEQGRP